jgi:hypothetical protein
VSSAKTSRRPHWRIYHSCIHDMQRTCCAHMQVPYESLKRTTRDRKGVVEEFTAIIEALQKATTASAQPQGTHVELLNDVDRRVGTLKRKVPEPCLVAERSAAHAADQSH